MALLGAALLACESAPPGAPSAADVLGAKTRGELLQVTALDPRCAGSRAGYEICVWKLGDKNSAWYALAESIDTGYRVNVICEFPSDGRPRERDCLVVEAVSRSTAGSSGRGRARREQAQALLDAAGTAWQITELVGDAPQRCSMIDDASRFCVWQATGHTRGFATLVKLLESRAPVQIACTIPEDGSSRAPGSCRVEPF